MSQKMFRQTASAIGILAILLGAIPGLADPTKVKFTHSVNRTAYRHVGMRTFTVGFVSGIGGVQQQQSVLVDSNDKPIKFSIDLLLQDGHYPDYVTLTAGSQTYRYTIRYEDLVPIALYVDSGGSALYSAWGRPPSTDPTSSGSEKQEGNPPLEDNASPTLTSTELQAGGFADDGYGGSVALEFKNTAFNEALQYVDFCEYCLGEVRNDLVEKLNHNLSGIPFDQQQPAELDHGIGTYLNSDVETIYRVALEDDAVIVAPEVIRYWWQELQGRSELGVRDARRFLSVEELSAKAADEALQIEKELAALPQDETGRIADLKDRLSDLDTGSLDGIFSDYTDAKSHHQEAFFLFSSLALLRNAKESNQQAWAAFMEKVRALAEVQSEPGRNYQDPWFRYQDAYCEVYPAQEECAQP